MTLKTCFVSIFKGGGLRKTNNLGTYGYLINFKVSGNISKEIKFKLRVIECKNILIYLSRIKKKLKTIKKN